MFNKVLLKLLVRMLIHSPICYIFVTNAKQENKGLTILTPTEKEL